MLNLEPTLANGRLSIPLNLITGVRFNLLHPQVYDGKWYPILDLELEAGLNF